MQIIREWSPIVEAAEKPLYIRTSGRIAYRQCRRAWSWATPLDNRVTGVRAESIAAPLWLGTGVHYALEDYHGSRMYKDSVEAFKAYVHGCVQIGEYPEPLSEHTEQGIAMLKYYQKWLNVPDRPKYKTLMERNAQGELVPCVEVGFEIPLPYRQDLSQLTQAPQTFRSLEISKWMRKLGADLIVYRGHIDRVAVDEYGALWIFEYKTAASYRNFHFEVDPQVTAYLWAARILWPDHPIAGVIYQQHHKNPPEPPRILSNGQLSVASTQNTTSLLYRESLIDLYGSVERAPKKQQRYLDTIRNQEADNRDKGVQWDVVTRTEKQLRAEENKITLELSEMLNPDLPIYPSPSDKCRWCDFRAPCVAVDSGYDYRRMLNESYEPREDYADDAWRHHLPLTTYSNPNTPNTPQY